MMTAWFRLCAALFLALSFAFPAVSQTAKTSWNGDVEKAYDTGFASMVMKNRGGGISLFNMDLVENDSPGSGMSEKGGWQDQIWGRNLARKEFVLDDPRAFKAWLVIYVTRQGRTPLAFTVNGRGAKVENWDELKNQQNCRWAEFPAEWLKNG